MSWISHIHAAKCGPLSKLDIDLHPRGDEKYRHLILTGPNGSGKSTLLRGVEEAIRRLERQVPKSRKPEYEVSLQWIGAAPSRDRPLKLSGWFPPNRGGRTINPTEGPKTLDVEPSKFNLNTDFGKQLQQLLVNRRTDQAFASARGERQKVDEIEKWFDDFQSHLRELWGRPDLSLEFLQEKYSFEVDFGDGDRTTFQRLADGHRSALVVFAELFVRRDAILREGSEDDSGVVLIDEIETHLHLAMQESILPFLTTMFPNVQFIVATHSPAVISSVDDAIVFDLRNRQELDSEDLQGIRYGTLMTQHFGIEADYDLETTQELKELDRLWKKTDRVEAEDHRLRELASRLSSRSHSLALEVAIKLNNGATAKAD